MNGQGINKNSSPFPHSMSCLSPKVLALELLDNHDTLNSMSVARLQRTMWHPMLQRCIALRSKAVKGWRLYDEILEPLGC